MSGSSADADHPRREGGTRADHRPDAPSASAPTRCRLPSASPAPGAQPIFPPKDADAETRRRWLASSPWPEVVFAAAGA